MVLPLQAAVGWRKGQRPRLGLDIHARAAAGRPVSAACCQPLETPKPIVESTCDAIIMLQ
jgi:hypothetical protein